MYFVISIFPCIEGRFPVFKIVDDTQEGKVMGFGYGPFVKLNRAKAWHKEVGLDQIDVGKPVVKLNDMSIMVPPCVNIDIKELLEREKKKKKGG